MTCATCGAENREEARFCDTCGAALAATPLREQRKTVTVLFCDVSGSTAFAESRDPESVRAVMNRYFEVARAAIERHGGTVEKFIGDAVMAVFGVPTIREDDALRAVRAAQELRDGVDIPVRIGVNTGEVVTGSGDSLVTGDAVNVAARLEQAAAAGEVLLGERTYELVRGAVDAELLPPFDAKGKSDLVTAYLLNGVTGEMGVARRLDAPFVGRAREQALLNDAWQRCVSGRACALFTVLGTAGVGKSRLASEFLDNVDATVVRGRCLSYGEGITYWPVVEVVLQLLQGAPPPSPAIAALLGNGFASADDIALATRKLFEAAAATRPLVIVLDDVQWGEPTFLDLVEHIADWSRDASILLLCLARPDLLDLRSAWGGGKLNATTVLLEPLSLAETDELIDGLVSGANIDSELREQIRTSADGNPLFVEQMLAMLEASPGEVTVPASIQALLAARLDQLPPRERAALERGAVEGQVFHRGAVAALAPEDPEVPLRLLGLVRKELVRPSSATVPGEEAFRFRHLLIRDAAYDALPKATRADLHECFADWLTERAPELVELDEVVGYHLEQASVYRAELGRDPGSASVRAGHHLAAAGAAAVARDDAHAAVSLLGRAAVLLPPGWECAIALARLGLAYELMGRYDEALGAVEAAIAIGDEDASLFAFAIRVVLKTHGGDVRMADLERDARDRLVATRAASDLSLASCYCTLALIEVWQGRVEAALEDAAIALDHARRANDRDFERKALVVLGMAYEHGSTPWPAVEEFTEVLAAAGLQFRATRAAAAAFQGRFDESRRLHEERLAELTERGATSDALAMGMSRGWVELLAGNPAGALEVLRKSWLGLLELGDRGYRSTVGANYAQALAMTGRPDDAQAVLDEVFAIAMPDDFITIAQAAIARALIASARADHEAAVELARAAVALTDAQEYLVQRHEGWRHLGEILLAAGRPEDAREALCHARDLAVQKGSTVVVARIDALLTTP